MTPRSSAHHSVLLVGFMGSGKSTVGPIVASLLDWDFLDFDELVEARAGRRVAEIFRDEGEETFRRLEAEVAGDALTGRERVLAAGGGWAAAPGRLEAVGPGVLSVWLRVSPETAVERVRAGGRGRPLLEVPDPVARARELLDSRRPFYGKACLHLDTEASSPERLARAIVRRL